MTDTTSETSASTNSIFFYDSRLRSGWAAVVFIVLLIALVSGLGFLAYLLLHGGHPPQHQGAAHSASTSIGPRILVNELATVVAVFLATWLMALIDRRSVFTYGLGAPRKAGLFLTGTATGLLALSALVGTLFNLHLVTFTQTIATTGPIFKYGAIWLLFFLCVGFFEENVTRGYLQYTLTRGIGAIYQHFGVKNTLAAGFWTTALLFSLLFGAGHLGNKGETPIGIAAASLIGLVFCVSLWRTGSLWWALGFHMAWDWAQSFLFGVADSGTMVRDHLLLAKPLGNPFLSGGTTGPEGSVFVLAAILLTLATVFLLPRQTLYPDLQPASKAQPPTA